MNVAKATKPAAPATPVVASDAMWTPLSQLTRHPETREPRPFAPTPALSPFDPRALPMTSPAAPHHATGAGDPVRLGDSVPRPSNVVVIGDSHTLGIVAALNRSSPRLRATSNDYRVNGTTLGQWAPGGAVNHQLVDALSRHPQHIVVSLGTNDGMAHASEASIRANVRAIVQQIRGAGVGITWALPLRTTTERAHIDRVRDIERDELQRLRAEGGGPINIVDISGRHIPLTGAKPHVDIGGIHATWVEGYDIWARGITGSYAH